MNSIENFSQEQRKSKALPTLVVIQLLIAIVTVAITATVGLKIKPLIEKKHQLEMEIPVLEQYKKSLEDSVKFLKTALPNALSDFGWSRDRISKTNLDTKIVEQSLQANIELKQFTSTTITGRRNITIQYFPKDVDQRKVDDALQNLGFKLNQKQAVIADISTNAIWFGEKVELDDVKLVAYMLTRAGVQIRSIEFFRAPTGRKASLIQVGASRFVVNDPIFTVDKIRALTFEQLQGRSRTDGD